MSAPLPLSPAALPLSVGVPALASAAPPLAQLHKAGKSYGAQRALDDVSFSVHRGEVLALLGANGAGKSTAIGLLLGLLQADTGSVEVLGGTPRTLAVRQRMGVMLQSAGLPDNSTVAELLMLTRSYYPRPRSVADCVALAGLDGLLTRRYGALSGGQQRRVQFALAICGSPALVFLDEPTTGLDIDARQRLWEAIRAMVRDGCGVLLTTHYLEEAEALADRLVVLDAGRVVAAGTMQAIRAHVSQRRIRCLSALEADRIAAWPGVHAAVRHGARLEIVADDADAVVRRLLADDAALTDLEVQRAGLADALIHLTRSDAAREAA